MRKLAALILLACTMQAAAKRTNCVQVGQTDGVHRVQIGGVELATPEDPRPIYQCSIQPTDTPK